MFARLLKRRAVEISPAASSLPSGMVVWAIGDIHGRLDLLKPLVEAILSEPAGSPTDRRVLVFLGDYIDRGPDSRGVIRYLSQIRNTPGVEFRFIKGNHEETMIQFLDDPSVGSQWCEYGGVETLASFGLRPPALKHKTAAWAHVSADLSHKLGENERAFLEDLELSLTLGDYFFCHAGARPGTPLDEQTPDDLMWIRRSFLDSSAGFDKVVVHGHTPSTEVYSDHRRIGVDTKAYGTGVLSAVRLAVETRQVMQANSTSDGVVVDIFDILPEAA